MYRMLFKYFLVKIRLKIDFLGVKYLYLDFQAIIGCQNLGRANVVSLGTFFFKIFKGG